MTADPRHVALVFLLGEHRLTGPEAEAALQVAAEVLRRDLTRLQAAETARDAATCQEAAHALKGCLLNLGLTALADQAQAVQEAAGRDEADRCCALVRELAAGLGSFFEEDRRG